MVTTTVIFVLNLFITAYLYFINIGTKEKVYVPESCETKTKAGDQLFMHYTGSIDESSATGTKGLVFDSSVKRNRPFDFVLGSGQVIKGWDQGKFILFELISVIYMGTFYYIDIGV